MSVVAAVLALVVLAIAIAALADRLRTPAPSLLVLAGLGVGFMPGVPTPTISPLLVTLGVLPPLLFAAAQQLSLPELRRVWRPVAQLAVGLVLATATAVALVAHAVDPALSLASAFVLGAILASTDPVAVSALSRRLRLPERIGTIVQAESLFNDATSLVLFQVAVLSVTAGGLGALHAVSLFVALAGGGLLVGLAVGVAAGWLLRRAHEPTAQTALALVTPYVAAVGAEAAHVSTVSAVIVTGLVIAQRRPGLVEAAGRLMATSVYDVVVFVLESVVFALIGLELAAFIRGLPDSDRAPGWQLVALVTLTLLAVRAASLLIGAAMPSLRARRRDKRWRARASGAWAAAAVVTWAGPRGVVPLAAALSVPLVGHAGAPFPHRQLLLVVTTGVVVITLVVQGTTLEPLVRRVGLTAEPRGRHDQLRQARYATASAALSALPQAAHEGQPGGVVERVRQELQQQLDAMQEAMQDVHPPPLGDGETRLAYRRLRRRLLEAEAEELARLRAAGEIGGGVYRQLLHEIDLDYARLTGAEAPMRSRRRFRTDRRP